MKLFSLLLVNTLSFVAAETVAKRQNRS